MYGRDPVAGTDFGTGILIRVAGCPWLSTGGAVLPFKWDGSTGLDVVTVTTPFCFFDGFKTATVAVVVSGVDVAGGTDF